MGEGREKEGEEWEKGGEDGRREVRMGEGR